MTSLFHSDDHMTPLSLVYAPNKPIGQLYCHAKLEFLFHEIP